MSFQGKYKVLSALNDGETQSYRAQQVSSGRSVLIHCLVTGRTPPGEPDLAFLVFKFLRGASAEEGRHLLDMGEDDGHIFVVTTDAPQCLDLRKWLLLVSNVESSKGAGPGQGSPLESGHFDFTRTFTSAALRQFTRVLADSSAPPAGASVPPPAASAKPSPESVTPPREAPPTLPPVEPGGSHDFTIFWEKYDLERDPGGSESKAAPSSPEKEPEKSAPIASPAAEPLRSRSPSSFDDSSNSDISSLLAQAAEHDRAHAPAAGAAEAKQGESGNGAPAIPGAVELHASIDEVDISLSLAPAPKPSTDASTNIPKLPGERMTKDGQPTPQPVVTAPTPSVEIKQPASGELAEQPTRRPIPRGFEVIFQSDKPRSRPTLSGVFDTTSIFGAPSAPGPPVGDQRPAPTPPEAKLPMPANPLEVPPAANNAGIRAIDSPQAPAEPRPPSGVALPPPPAPTFIQELLHESDRPTRLVGAPPVPLSKPSPSAPAGALVPEAKAPPVPSPPPQDPLPGRGVFSAPSPPAANPEPSSRPLPASNPPPPRGQPGEYTRMVEDVRAVAGPLPPLDSPEPVPVGPRQDASLALPSPLSAQASHLNVRADPSSADYGRPSKLQPSIYIADDTPAYPVGKRRKVWVPIVILSILFLMALGVLLFFSLKN